MKRQLFAMLLMALCTTTLYAQQQMERILRHVQADGRTVSYTTIGTKPTYYAQTLDGYTLWRTSEGDLVYATTDSTGQMVPSEVLAADDRTVQEALFVASLPKGLRFRLPLKAGHLLGGTHFQHTATPSDSLLVVIVEFSDEQFSHSKSTVEQMLTEEGYNGTGSFKDYYYDQSGGQFNPGVRVVGPVHLPNNKSYYNQTSWLGSTVHDMIQQAINSVDAEVDFSHFDNDGDGTVDAVVFYYAGLQPQSNSDGLWPHASSVSGLGLHDGKSFADYCIFAEGDPVYMPAIGTLCHEFGHLLGLPDLYDVTYDTVGGRQARTPMFYSLMCSGNYNANGTLPPNLSIFERHLLGWVNDYDTLQVGDSLTLRALGKQSASGYYLPLDGDEFLAFEVRSSANQWDSGLGIETGGLIVYHGKESKLNTASNAVINTTVGDEGWYVVSANGWGWLGGGDAPTLFSPTALHKPMLNDSTVIDSIWISNIRWVDDSTMAFNFTRERPIMTLVSPEALDLSRLNGSSFTARGRIELLAGTLTAKGVVYATTPEECTLGQGTVIYDTTLTDTLGISATATGLIPGTTYCYRLFATAGGQTSLSAVQSVTIRRVSLRHIYYQSDYYNDHRYYFDIELSANVDHYHFFEYMSAYHIAMGSSWFNDPYLATDRWDLFDISGPHPQDYHDNMLYDNARHRSFGLWIVTTNGDTIPELFVFDTTQIDTISTISYHPTVNVMLVNGQPVQELTLTSNTIVDSSNLVVLPIAELKELVRYYLAYSVNVDSTEHWSNELSNWVHLPDTTNQWLTSLERTNSYSLYARLLRDYPNSQYSRGSSFTLPVLGDNLVAVVMTRDMRNIVQFNTYTTPTSTVINSGDAEAYFDDYSYSGGKYTLDTFLTISLNRYVDYYNLLYGTQAEMQALGVTDQASAEVYCTLHANELPHYQNVGGSYYTSSIHTTAPWLPNTNYIAYVVPFNSAGEVGTSDYLSFQGSNRIIDVLPGQYSYYPNTDTSWWKVENGELVWQWHYEELVSNNFLGEWHTTLLPEGTLDSLLATGITTSQLLPMLETAGKTLHYEGSYPFFYNTHTASNLILDTTYVVGMWSFLTNPITGTTDTIFQRTAFSTHDTPHLDGATIKKLYYSWGIYNNDTVNYCLIDADESTAYYHVIFGTETELSAQGISTVASAGQYSLTHHSTLEQYHHQTMEISYMAGTDGMGYSHFATYMTWEEWGPNHHSYYCWRKHVTQSMSPDNVYRIYVIPYSANNEQGIVRTIRFSPGGIVSDSAENGMVTECSVSDITANTATLHGSVQPGRHAMSVVGFVYMRDDAPSGTEATTITIGPLTGSAFSYRLHGLQPNTTYHYAVAKSYDTSTSVYSSAIYFNPHTFTTASCTVSASIDTTICYNAYYGNTHYTSSQTLEFTYTAANGCDSLLTVNLTVLPQRIGMDTVMLCYGEEYNGSPRYASITQTETIQEEGVCDSTHMLRLEVLPQIETSIRDTLHGDTFEWGGEELTQPGQYTQVFTAANGCDSTVHLTLVAEPEIPHNGIDDADNVEINITVDGHIITVAGSDGNLITIYDVAGRLLATRRDGIRLETPTAGIYFVQIGTLPVRKVVVVR